jgi:hypothetical protein
LVISTDRRLVPDGISLRLTMFAHRLALEVAIMPRTENLSLKYFGICTNATGGPATTAVAVWGNTLQNSEQFLTTSTVGTAVGSRVGVVGAAVGPAVSTAVGLRVGFRVGFGTGMPVG